MRVNSEGVGKRMVDVEVPYNECGVGGGWQGVMGRDRSYGLPSPPDAVAVNN